MIMIKMINMMIMIYCYYCDKLNLSPCLRMFKEGLSPILTRGV